MILKEIFKYFFFLFHLFLIAVAIVGSLLNWNVIILQAIPVISWQFNNNKCLLTQIEDYLFDETIIDFYFRLIGSKRDYVKYVVPKCKRYLAYLLLLINIIKVVN